MLLQILNFFKSISVEYLDTPGLPKLPNWTKVLIEWDFQHTAQIWY